MEEGRVERIWENRTRDGKPYWVFKINGERYSAFDEDAVQGVREGDEIRFNWKKAGRYRNLDEVSVCSSPETHGHDGYDHQVSIVRMSCLRSATELLRYPKIAPDQKMELALDWARRFEHYVLGASTD